MKAMTVHLKAGADSMPLQLFRNWGSMKRSTLYFSLFFIVILSVSGLPKAHAESAKRWYKLGQKAEAQNQVEQAYQDYYKAYKMKPGDESYRVAYERTRLPASALHVEHGEQLEKLGDNSGAVAEFLLALQIDPSNELATQDIEAIRRRVNAVKAGTNAESPRTPEEALERLEGPVQLRPLSNEPLTLHMVEDSKVVYQTVCKAAGINVLFDPDYTSKRIQVDLQNTTFRQALQIIATVSGTFYQAITPNTIFVAANTRAKRSELETQAVETFYLHNVTQQSDFTDVQTALRNVFQTAHIFGVASQNAIVMRASPDELILAKKLIDDLDRPKPEVVVDVAVLEVSRNLERKIGLQLPQTASVNIQAATSSSSSTSGTSTSTTPTTSSGLTLNNIAHLNSNNFAVTIGQAEADLLLSDSDTQVIQEPRIRASDGQDAQLKIGERLPVATGSYQTGAATAIVSSLVNTQFQYLDVGVNIDVTPTVLYDRDVSMKVKLTVSAENGTENLGGVNEPIITQRVADETVRLKNGEANLIGGIKQIQTSNSVSGTPGLAELPLLKYLFGVHDHTVQKDDLVFLLIPHVIRARMLTPQQTAAIYTGTANNFSVRMASEPVEEKSAESGATSGAAGTQPTSSAPASAVPAGSSTPASAQSQPQPQGAGTGQTAEGAAKSAMQQMNAQMGSGPPVLLKLDPQQTNVAAGKTFQLKVNLEDGKDVYAVPLRVKYDAARLSLINVDLTGSPNAPNSFLGKDGQAVALVHRDDGNGQVEISASRPPGVKGVSGNGTVCVLTFKAKAAGDATVAVTRPVIRNSQDQSISAVGSLAVVHVE